MLTDLIDALLNAKSKKEIERAFRDLEKVGVDRMTACIMASIRLKEKENIE